MNIYVFLLVLAMLGRGALADDWWVDWNQGVCTNHENIPHWSVRYGSKEECCKKVYWWREYECNASLSGTPKPSPAPTKVSRPSFGGGNAWDGGVYSGGKVNEGSKTNVFGGDASVGTGGQGQHGSSGSDKTVWLTPVADTYIRNDRPLKNYGKQKVLKVGTDNETVTLIKFDLVRVRRKCICKATLSLYSLAKSRNGGAVTTFDPKLFSRDEHWDEASIDWNNAPKERPYTFFSEIGRVGENEWVDVDVTKELGTNRLRTFRIVGGKFAQYASKESEHRPLLSVELC